MPTLVGVRRADIELGLLMNIKRIKAMRALDMARAIAAVLSIEDLTTLMRDAGASSSEITRTQHAFQRHQAAASAQEFIG